MVIGRYILSVVCLISCEARLICIVFFWLLDYKRMYGMPGAQLHTVNNYKTPYHYWRLSVFFDKCIEVGTGFFKEDNLTRLLILCSFLDFLY